MKRNLGELVRDASRQHAEHVAFQVRRGLRVERISYRRAGELAHRFAGWLAERGLVSGDRIIIWSPNMPEYPVCFFGAWLAGVVVVPVDARTRQEVLDRFVAAARPRLGFKSRFLEGTFAEPVEETFALEDLFDLIADAAPLDPLPDVGPEHLAEIAFTSGTTGVPKGVMLTHGNLLAETEGVHQTFPLPPHVRVVSILPLSHLLEQTIGLLLPFTSGGTMNCVPRVNTATIQRVLREERITCMQLVPEVLRLLLDGIERQVRRQGRWRQWQAAHRVARYLPVRARHWLFRDVHRALGGHLQFLGCGGAPLDLKLASAWERMGIPIFEGYGLTETSAASTLNNRLHKKLGSVGRPIPGVEVRIASDGEILLRGPTVTPGYLDNPDLTARSFTDGWFRSGDVGAIDHEGFLHVSGRQAFRIVLADGRNVYPEDIEQVLNLHPLVRQSCVVGVRGERGEAVHAVLLTDAPARAAEIVREVNGRLAPQQQIAGVTVWQEEDFPRTPILKIDRKLVLEAVERKLATAEALRPAAPLAAAEPLLSLVTRLATRAPMLLREEAVLETDLGLDSLGRAELVAAIQEEMGRTLDESRLGPQTTLAELRRLAEAAASAEAAARPAPRWPRAWWARALRSPLLRAMFRLQDRWMEFEVVHPERAGAIPLPSILIFNYQGPYVPLAVLRVLPSRLRARTAVAADSRLWEGRARWKGLLSALIANAFPFVKSGGAVRSSLEELGRWLDAGCCVIVSPEGNPEPPDGSLLPFLGGTGLMAVEMQVPVVPFRFEGYNLCFPPRSKFPYLPNRKGRVRVIIGEPVTFSRTTPHQEATDRLRRALIETR